MKRSLLHNISANLFTRITAYVFSFITLAWAARILQPDAFGRISFASSFTGYIIMLANLGMPIYGMRKCAENRDDRKALNRVASELWSISLLLSLASLIAETALVLSVPRLWQERTLCLIYGSSVLFQAIGAEWLYKGLEKFRFLAVCQLGVKCLSFLLMLAFIRSEEQLPLYAGLSVLGAYGSHVICFIRIRKYADLSFRINRDHFKPLLIFFLMSCAVSIYNSLDLTMLGFMRSDFETGLYAVAAKGKAALTVMGGVVWASILPRAAHLWKKGERKAFESLAGKSLFAVFSLQLTLTVFFWIFAEQTMVLIGGESYTGAKHAFRILLLSLVPIGISNILGGQVLIPSGHEKGLLLAEAAGAVINFIANLFVIPVWSLEGAAVTTVVSETVVTVICFFYIKKVLRMDFGWALIQKIVKRAGKEIKRRRAILLGKTRKEKLPFQCSCCGTWLNAFTEGAYKLAPDQYDSKRYEHTRQDVICPVCGALPRHRILALWCEQHMDELTEILYFAPEAGMMKWMKRKGISCVTADLMAAADLMIDIQDTKLPSQAYHLIICNHVLEHVDDFRAALREVKRILKDDGCFICSFPMDPGIELLDEDPGVRTDRERITRFGQVDHQRVFGMKADQLLAQAGFAVERIRGEDYPERILPVIGPADYDINLLFCCRKR